MVMTLRDFEIESSYGEWDLERYGKKLGDVDGERAYQVLKGTTRPAEGFPCRVVEKGVK